MISASVGLRRGKRSRELYVAVWDGDELKYWAHLYGVGKPSATDYASVGLAAGAILLALGCVSTSDYEVVNGQRTRATNHCKVTCDELNHGQRECFLDGVTLGIRPLE